MQLTSEQISSAIEVADAMPVWNTGMIQAPEDDMPCFEALGLGPSPLFRKTGYMSLKTARERLAIREKCESAGGADVWFHSFAQGVGSCDNNEPHSPHASSGVNAFGYCRMCLGRSGDDLVLSVLDSHRGEAGISSFLILSFRSERARRNREWAKIHALTFIEWRCSFSGTLYDSAKQTGRVQRIGDHPGSTPCVDLRFVGIKS